VTPVVIATWVALAALLTVAGIAASLAWSHWRFTAYHRHKGIELPPLSAVDVLRLHVGEALAWFVLGGWVFRAAFQDRLVVPSVVRGPPVVCVHGFTQNGTNFWGIRQALGARGRPHRAVWLGRPFQPLVGYQPRLERVLDEVAARFPDQPIDLVCHSMGGIIARLVLRDRPDLAARVRHVVTLGSPHAGTAAPRGFAVAPDVRQLSRRSDVLAKLPPLQELLPHADITSVAAIRDFIVYPHESALLPGTRQVVLHHVGHAGLLTRAEVIAVVADAIDPIVAEDARASA
jgi:pimeloyl-ACP methyl ester carboxylesterase